MGAVYFCSDLHLDHENIANFRKHVCSPEHNEELIFNDWEHRVNKRDLVFVLGDAAFSKASLERLGTLPGRKKLIRGNHDNYVTTEELLEVFESVEGLFRYKGWWLSHAPIHPAELRGKMNLHGHVHYETLDDLRYFNCCVENVLALTGRYLIKLEEVREIFDKRFGEE